jgi:phosphoglycerate dehydrogenase-like enzyme
MADTGANIRSQSNMPGTTRIAILDDDHVTRMVRYALAGPGEIAAHWVREFFLPEDFDPARVHAAGHGLRAADGVTVIPMAEKIDISEGADAGILIFRRGTVDAAMMQANPRLKLIQRVGARADNIDLNAAAARGILVACLPRRTMQYTAEHAILLMLALSKRLIEADGATRSACWDHERVRPEQGVAYNWPGLDRLGGLFGTTVGIIGLGEVGSMVAQMARGFGARVVYTNRKRLAAEQEQRLGVTSLPLARLLAEADFVSMHANNLPENKGLIGAPIFAQMKPTAFFINTSRGRMVDEDALYTALTTDTIAGAGLDVHAEEPRPADRFAKLRNVIMTPHLAGGSRTAVVDEITAVLENCRAVLAGQPIKYQVTNDTKD